MIHSDTKRLIVRKNLIMPRNLTHPIAVNLYENKPPDPKLEEQLSNNQRRTLSQLRTGGHSTILNSYRKRIDNTGTNNGLCRFCHADEETISHILNDCVHIPISRNNGTKRISVDTLYKDPGGAIEFLEGLGFLSKS